MNFTCFFILPSLTLNCFFLVKPPFKVTNVTGGVGNLFKFGNTTKKINQFLSEGILFFLNK